MKRKKKKPPANAAAWCKLLGEAPRIELFAREKAPGWDAWGDEIEGGNDHVKDP